MEQKFAEFMEYMNEHVEKVIGKVGNVDRFELRMLVKVLPRMVEFLNKNENHHELAAKAMAGDQEAIDLLAQKLGATIEEKNAFKRYAKFSKMQYEKRLKEAEQFNQKNCDNVKGYDRKHPHAWFSFKGEQLNRIIKYISIIKPDYCHSANGCTLSLKTGALQLRRQGDNFQLIIPVISGSFCNNRGEKKEFSGKHIIASYKQGEIYYHVHIKSGELDACVEGLKNGSISVESNIAIADEQFPEFLNAVPRIFTKVHMDIGKLIQQEYKVVIIPLWSSTNTICFKIYVDSAGEDIDYTTLVDVPEDMLFVRNAPILYKNLREQVITELKNSSLNNNEHCLIVTDDIRGVYTTGHLHLHDNANDRNLNFFEFFLTLNSSMKSIETYIKGEIKIGWIYNDFQMRTMVYYDIDFQDNRVSAKIKMNKLKNYWVWSASSSISVSNGVDDLGKAHCESIVNKLNAITFEWPYQFLLSIQNIQFYNEKGHMSIKYKLGI